MLDASSRNFEMLMIDLDTLPGWLFSIDALPGDFPCRRAGGARRYTPTPDCPVARLV
jgi:hypothetical protein